MNHESLVAGLTTKALGRPLHFFESTESTNLDLRALAAENAPHGTSVVARTQTGGRGRRGHRWFSPPDVGLYASFLVRGPAPLERVPLFTLATALAAQRAIHSSAALDVGIRWPNDLLCRRTLRKLGGILVESSADEAGFRYAVIGVGLNLTALERPPPLDGYATSIEEAGGRPTTIEAVFGALAGRLEEVLELLARSRGTEQMLEAYDRFALGRGEAVEIADDRGEAQRGRMLGLAPDGGLRLETDTGPAVLYAGMLRLPGAPIQPEW